MKRIFTKKNIVWFLILNLGLIITAAGINFFKAPNHFAFGGTSGLSILMESLFPSINLGMFMFIINGILVVFGVIFLGKSIMGATLYSSFALSLYVWLFGLLFPMTKPFTDDTFLEMCFAVILPAVGSAVLFNIDASSGGTDIVAMILSKKTSLEIGKALFVCDLLIALGAGLIFGIRTGLYCVLGLVAKSLVVDGAMENFNLKKKVSIVSSKTKEVNEFIINVLNRSATVYTAYGAYSGEEQAVITTILGRRQAVQLRNYIRKVDPEAFITIVNSSETIGKGFRTI